MTARAATPVGSQALPGRSSDPSLFVSPRVFDANADIGDLLEDASQFGIAAVTLVGFVADETSEATSNLRAQPEISAQLLWAAKMLMQICNDSHHAALDFIARREQAAEREE